jgi:hypothetical protein
MQLSEHFSLEQLTASVIATRKGIPNVPDADQVENLRLLAQYLENVQSLLGRVLVIDSAFRSLKLNSAIGGSSTSAHLEGYAADFVCPAFGTPREICEAIAGAEISFDQLIQEGATAEGGGWTHLSIAPAMRGEILTATFLNGKAVYSQGLA